MTAWPPIARNKRDVRDDACASAVAVTTTRYGPSTRANLVFWPRPVVRYPTTDPSRGLWGPKSPGSELSDLTITMTNVGDQGVDAVFGVIYPPQVALVSFGKPAQRVCAVDGAIHVMTTVLATLPADHGCSDDHRGALFFLSINELTRCAAVTG